MLNWYLQSDIENYVVKLGICNNVEFLGSMAIESLALEYAKATCLVLPSVSEPWGLVVNEALSYGCPVVVSNVCGCVPELVRFGITGFDFEVGDVGGLAAFLLKIVRDFGDSEAVAKRCIDVVSQYSPERAAQQIFDGSMAILRGRIA
jgi:glycosyltransferase involved in cell wall biosynthesis